MSKEFKTRTPGVKKYEKKTYNKVNKSYYWYKVECRIKDCKGYSTKYKKGGFQKESEAIEHMNKVKNEMKRTSDTIFGYVYDKFMEKLYRDCTGNYQMIKASTFELKQCVLKNHIYDYFKDMRLSDIDSEVIEDWKNDLKNDKYSLKNRGKPKSNLNDENSDDLLSYSLDYLNRCLNYLNQLFNYAVKQGYIEESPMKNISKFVNCNKKETKRINISKYWSVEEYNKFIKYIKKYKKHYYYIFETAFWSGARIGEVLALRKKDIDFNRKVIYINENISGKEAYKENGEYKFKQKVTSPKNGKTRVVTMDDAYFKEISEYMNSLYGLKDEDRIFNISKKTAQNFFKKAQERMNEDEIEIKRMTIHGLRHAHIIQLLSSNENIYLSKIGDRVGHSRAEITEMYADIIDDKDRTIANYNQAIRNNMDF